MYAVLNIVEGSYVPINYYIKWAWYTEQGAKNFDTMGNVLSDMNKYELIELQDNEYNEVTWNLVNG